MQCYMQRWCGEIYSGPLQGGHHDITVPRGSEGPQFCRRWRLFADTSEQWWTRRQLHQFSSDHINLNIREIQKYISYVVTELEIIYWSKMLTVLSKWLLEVEVIVGSDDVGSLWAEPQHVGQTGDSSWGSAWVPAQLHAAPSCTSWVHSCSCCIPQSAVPSSAWPIWSAWCSCRGWG